MAGVQLPISLAQAPTVIETLHCTLQPMAMHLLHASVVQHKPRAKRLLGERGQLLQVPQAFQHARQHGFHVVSTDLRASLRFSVGATFSC